MCLWCAFSCMFFLSSSALDTLRMDNAQKSKRRALVDPTHSCRWRMLIQCSRLWLKCGVHWRCVLLGISLGLPSRTLAVYSSVATVIALKLSQRVVEVLVAAGDTHLRYLSGLELFNEEDAGNSASLDAPASVLLLCDLLVLVFFSQYGADATNRAHRWTDMMPDLLHPNGDGYELLGQRFATRAFGPAGLLIPGRCQGGGATL